MHLQAAVLPFRSGFAGCLDATEETSIVDKWKIDEFHVTRET